MKWIYDDAENVFASLGKHVCPIFCHKEGTQQPFLVGSAVPFTTGSDVFLLTATHVLAHLRDNTLITFGSEQLVRFDFRSSQIVHRPGTIDADVGVLKVPAEAVERLAPRFHFTKVEEIGEVQSYDKLTVYLLVGYPHSKNKPKPKFETITARPFFFMLRAFYDLKHLNHLGKRDAVHFCLEAPPDALLGLDMKPMVAPTPKGMSGGGVWRMTFDGHTGAISAPELVGIGIEYHARPAVFIATRVSYVLELVRRFGATE